LIYILEDEYFRQTGIDSTRQLIRLLFEPSFDLSYGITLELKNNQTYVTTKLANGLKGTYSEYLSESLLQLLPSNIFYENSKALHRINFEKVSNDQSTEGWMDGASIALETIEKGKYSYCKVYCPYWSKEPETKELWNIYSSIIKIAKVHELDSLQGRKRKL
jgi:hypothetical protein